MLKLISVLYTAGCRGGLDVCDVIFEGGPGKCNEGGGVNFSLKSRDVIYGRSHRPSLSVKSFEKTSVYIWVIFDPDLQTIKQF